MKSKKEKVTFLILSLIALFVIYSVLSVYMDLEQEKATGVLTVGVDFEDEQEQDELSKIKIIDGVRADRIERVFPDLYKDFSFEADKEEKKQADENNTEKVLQAIDKVISEVEMPVQKPIEKSSTSKEDVTVQILALEREFKKQEHTVEPASINRPVKKEKTRDEIIAEARRKQRLKEKEQRKKYSEPFTLVVFQDQYVLPNDRLELKVSEDFLFDGERYETNTSVYAFISVSQNRVLFDIDNINHTALEVKAFSPTDGREGLYSKKGGELYNMYQEKARRATQDHLQDQVTNELGSRGLIGGVSSIIIESLGDFFKRKRIRKSKRIFFRSGTEILIKVRPVQE